MSRQWANTSGSPGERYYKPLSLLFLILIFVGYWLYAWQLERISEVYTIPTWWDSMVMAYPLLDFITPFLLVPLQMLSPRVLRHLVPLIVGFVMARIVVQRFIESFYDLVDRAAARSLLGRLTGSLFAAQPNIAVSAQSMIRETRHSLMKVGGPGSISVARGYALVTERNGHFMQVLGPGTHAMSRFEYPRFLVDVRPQERETERMSMVTRDGIELQVLFSIAFQISQGKKSPTKAQSFPFDDDAVKKAAYGAIVFRKESTTRWEDLVVLFATRELTEIIAESRLDELLNSESLGIYPHPRLTSELRRRVQGELINLGVNVLDIHLGRFELPDQIIEQNIRKWQVYRRNQNSFRESMSAELSVVESDIAWTLAEAEFVEAMVAAAGQIDSVAGAENRNYELAIFWTTTLERLAARSGEVTEYPEHLLEKISNLRQELEISGGLAKHNMD